MTAPDHCRTRRFLRLLCAVAAVVASGVLASGAGAAPLSNAGPVLAQLASQAKDGSLSQEDRLEALEVLAKWNTAEVRPVLLELLRDPAPEIRSLAARGLGWPGNAPAIAALRDRASDKSEPSAVRAAAVGALVRIGDPATRPMLVETTKDPDPQVREQALRGFVEGPLQMPADRVALTIRAVEDGDLNPSFRAEAIRQLAATKDPTAVPVLLAVLENGPRLKIPVTPPSANQNQILQSRYLQIRDVRAWAARALGELGDRSALPALLKATEDADDFFVRYLASASLASWSAPQALPAFVRLLGDPSQDTRLIALRGVALVGNQSNVEAVAAKLNDDVMQVRIGASETLAMLGGPVAVQRLQAARQTEVHPEVRQALDNALAHLKAPSSPGRPTS